MEEGLDFGKTYELRQGSNIGKTFSKLVAEAWKQVGDGDGWSSLFFKVV